MADRVAQALALWGWEDAQAQLYAHRENSVYRVHTDEGVFALRFHRIGYHGLAELEAERQWTGFLAERGMVIARPKAALSGDYVIEIEGMFIDAQDWLVGETINQVGLSVDLFKDLGALMADLHGLSDEWTTPEGFTRPSWDRAGLVGADPFWNRFWENNALSEDQRAWLGDLRMRIDAGLRHAQETMDFGLIHADMLGDNVLITKRGLAPIDFDDSGFGFRLFEFSTPLHKLWGTQDYARLRDALFEGYGARRKLDLTGWEWILLARSASVIGWLMTRHDVTEPQARLARAVDELASIEAALGTGRI